MTMIKESKFFRKQAEKAERMALCHAKRRSIAKSFEPSSSLSKPGGRTEESEEAEERQGDVER
jgi:hypothetical protein